MPRISDIDKKTTLRTVERAIGVLDLIATSTEAPRVRGISDALGLNLSTTYHIVNTLIANGYVARGVGGGLSIGPGVAVLHTALESGSGHVRQVQPFLQSLASESGDTAYLTRWDGASVVIAAVAEGRESLRVTGLQVGFSGCEDRRASGRAVLAFLPNEDLVAVTARLFGPLTLPDRAERQAHLDAVLAAVRAIGYATDEEDYAPGICCVAAPYFDAAGGVAGSVTVSAPMMRLGVLRRTVLPRVRAAARDMTRVLSEADGSVVP
jgi:DNA-binding IclR family transcriptional regulator